MNNPNYESLRHEIEGQRKEKICDPVLDVDEIILATRNLVDLLNENHIKFTIKAYFGGIQIRFDDGPDVILHEGSYGREEYLWESYGFPEDNGDVTGYLTAEDVIGRLTNKN